MGVERLVQFRSDGLGLSPGEYARLLGEIAATRGICTDDYSCGGVVAELEAKMATLLGKEAAVFLPTGTLANHLAVRLLARSGRRVLVQAESHLWNDEGDCAQTLSGLTLVPLAPGRATVSLAEIQTAAAGAPGMRVAFRSARSRSKRRCGGWQGRRLTRRSWRQSLVSPASAGSGCISMARGCCWKRPTQGSRRRRRRRCSTRCMSRCGNTSTRRTARSSPGRATCSTGFTISAACLAAACHAPGLTRQ